MRVNELTPRAWGAIGAIVALVLDQASKLWVLGPFALVVAVLTYSRLGIGLTIAAAAVVFFGAADLLRSDSRDPHATRLITTSAATASHRLTA